MTVYIRDLFSITTLIDPRIMDKAVTFLRSYQPIRSQDYLKI